VLLPLPSAKFSKARQRGTGAHCPHGLLPRHTSLAGVLPCCCRLHLARAKRACSCLWLAKQRLDCGISAAGGDLCGDYYPSSLNLLAKFESESGYKHPRPRLTRSRVSTNIGSSGSISCAQSQHRPGEFRKFKSDSASAYPQPLRLSHRGLQAHLQLSVTARHTDRLAGQSQPKLSRLSFELESGDRERRG
jgi:hypothetical protein